MIPFNLALARCEDCGAGHQAVLISSRGIGEGWMEREYEADLLGRMRLIHERAVPLLRKLSLTTNPNVISPDLPKSFWTPLDLSVNNPLLVAQGVKNPLEFHDFIFDQISKERAHVGYGGVFETREWYQRSDIFGAGQEVRNLHIGLDIWCAAGTSVVCPVEGVVHSFQNNKNFLDYGPTVILEHNVEGETFYSLYGHLSLDSLSDKKVGQKIEKDECFGWIGDPSHNGGWPPHLHFQLMLDMLGNSGDFVGVCSPEKRGLYELVCPSPLLLLL